LHKRNRSKYYSYLQKEEKESTMGKEMEVAVAATSDVTGEKQGAKCCGCCCDYRRAVVVIAIIDIVVYVIVCVLIAVGTGIGTYYFGQIGDDDLVTAGQIGIGVIGGVTAALYGVAALGGVFKLFAALKYNICMLVTTIVFDLIGFASNIYYYSTPVQTPQFDETTMTIEYIESPQPASTIASGIVGSIIFTGLIIYPTVGLIMEIKKGIMSPETYPREAYSCCCEPKV
jgi:hypothetical protein